MPLYDCGASECEECETAFGPDRSKAIAAHETRARQYQRHTHVAGTTHGRPIDECAFCGLDLRCGVHLTEDGVAPPSARSIP